MSINYIIIPIIVLIIVIYAYIKKVDIINEFIDGVILGYKSALNLFPTILFMLLGVNILIGSNIINDVFIYLTKMLHISDYYADIILLAILKPISGSASLGVLNNILSIRGVDSYIGNIASMLCASTDTTIYIIATYFASVKIRDNNHVLKVGLLTDFFTVIIVLLVAYLFFR